MFIDIDTIVFRHQLTSALSSLSLISAIHLCYKSIINYDLDITNILVVSPQVCYNEVFDITNPRFNEQIWPFIKSRFHCIHICLVGIGSYSFIVMHI